MIIRFTQNAQTVLRNSKKYAVELGSSYVGTEHLLLSILSTDCVGCKILNDSNVYYDDALETIMKITNNYNEENPNDVPMSPALKLAIQRACKVAPKFIGSEHLLYAICEQNESLGAKILVSLGKNLQTLMARLAIEQTN